MFQTTDGDDARWAVNMILIRFQLALYHDHLEGDTTRHNPDQSHIYAETRERLDRLYRGRTPAREMILELDAL